MDSTFGKRLKSARTSLKLTQKELASQIGVKHNSISDWENDKNKPDPDTIELLCGVLEISPNYLLGSRCESSISPSELEHLKKYRSLDDHGKKIVDMVINEEYIRSTSPKEQTIFYSIPYSYDLPAYAGGGQYVMDIAHFKNVTLSEKPPKGTDFMIRVSGDSMEPKFSDGDKVFIKRNDAVEIGEIGLFYVDGGIYIKKQGYNELISLNPQYSPILVNEFSSTKCFGKVLGKCECEIFDV